MLFIEIPLLAITSETLYLQGETPELENKKMTLTKPIIGWNQGHFFILLFGC